jgi:hypothetical protein
VASGANVNAKDDHGYTALHYAAYRASPSRFRVWQLLLAAGADVNATSHSGDTPLYFAACDSWPAAVELLLSAGAAADAKNLDGVTPLSVAATSASGPLSRRMGTRPTAPAAHAAETFDCFMAHNSTQPLPPITLVATAAAAVSAAAATTWLRMSRDRAVSAAYSRQGTVIRQLLACCQLLCSRMSQRHAQHC